MEVRCDDWIASEATQRARFPSDVGVDGCHGACGRESAQVTVVRFVWRREGVFQREAIGGAQIVANRFGGDPVTVAAALGAGDNRILPAEAGPYPSVQSKMYGGRPCLQRRPAGRDRAHEGVLVCSLRLNMRIGKKRKLFGVP
jgi:hypothetical protein